MKKAYCKSVSFGFLLIVIILSNTACFFNSEEDLISTDNIVVNGSENSAEDDSEKDYKEDYESMVASLKAKEYEESVMESLESSLAESLEASIGVEQAANVTVPETVATAQTSAYTPKYALYSTLYVVNCRESISLRTEPSTSAYAKRQIPLGAAVSYIETAGNGFYKISYMGDEGYSLASYLSTSPHNSYTTPTAATTAAYSHNLYSGDWLQVVRCNVSITLRTYPSTKAQEIRQIPLGDYVKFMDTAENGFYYVEYDGSVGYALASYLAY